MVRDYDSSYKMSYGAPCGEYFSYEAISDQEVATFKVPVTKKEERLAVNALVRIDRRRLEIKIDDTKQIPTAEWVSRDSAEVRRPNRVIIRISSRDYEAAPCLAGL
jgi:hypothetical protein